MRRSFEKKRSRSSYVVCVIIRACNYEKGSNVKVERVMKVEGGGSPASIALKNPIDI